MLSAQPVSKPAKANPAIFGRPQDIILRLFPRYHYLTSRQICRLLYKPGSLTYVQTVLKELTEAGLLQRIFLPRPSQFGSAPSVYTLARKGRNFLDAQGYDISYRYHPSEEREHAYLFLSHTLAVNDLFLATELLCRRLPQLTLATIQHERSLKQQPMYVEDSDGQRLAVVMDGWIDLLIDDARHMCLGLEVDMGTVEQKKWRRKVQGLIACSQGPYQERFGTPSLTVAVVATPGEKRLSDLLRWTESELNALQASGEVADLFRLAAVSPDTDAPEDVFLSPRWYRPFQREPIPLIEGIL